MEHAEADQRVDHVAELRLALLEQLADRATSGGSHHLELLVAERALAEQREARPIVEPRLVVAPPRQIGEPRFSPDGLWIAFVSGLGLGEDFQEANIKDFGYGDLRDIRASVRAAAAIAPIDTDRVGIMGWSYGGFMAMWAPTQTHEFRAAVAGAGISSWQSYHGQTDIPGWMLPFFGATVYDDPAVYAKSSPIAFVKQARTPTLMLVGEVDTDCPPPQSRELWQALRTLGVPAQLVVYPNEAHGFVQAEHRRDRVERIVDWFNRHMPAR